MTKKAYCIICGYRRPESQKGRRDCDNPWADEGDHCIWNDTKTMWPPSADVPPKKNKS